MKTDITAPTIASLISSTPPPLSQALSHTCVNDRNVKHKHINFIPFMNYLFGLLLVPIKSSSYNCRLTIRENLLRTRNQTELTWRRNPDGVYLWHCHLAHASMQAIWPADINSLPLCDTARTANPSLPQQNDIQGRYGRPRNSNSSPYQRKP